MQISATSRSRIATAGLALAGLILAGIAPAQASERPIDITGYSVSSITVADSNCRYVSVRASSKVKSDYNDAYASIDVTRQGGLVDSLWFDNRKVSDRALICPSWDGLGTYKVGPADVSTSYTYWDSYFGYDDIDYVDYTDRTSKSFSVRGKT